MPMITGEKILLVKNSCQILHLMKTGRYIWNFNYQVQNGEFSQWVFNNYNSDIDDIEEFIENCDFDKKDVFERMFENYRCIKASLDNLNGYDDFYY